LGIVACVADKDVEDFQFNAASDGSRPDKHGRLHLFTSDVVPAYSVDVPFVVAKAVRLAQFTNRGTLCISGHPDFDVGKF
jgi:hypothetical protein